MRNLMILAVASLAAFSAPAFAQSALTTPSQTAQPVMPAPRDYPNPNANVQPMSNTAVPEGRAVAPAEPMGSTAPKTRMHSAVKGN